MTDRQEFIKLIEKNILKFGYHVTLVNRGQNPHFAYTIGLYKKFGFELVIAGGFTSIKNYERSFDLILAGLNSGNNLNSIFKSNDMNCENMKLLEMHSSWKNKMIFGAYDYYKLDSIKALQILPIGDKLLDVPIMSEPFDKNNPVWKWLSIEWNKNAPKTAYVITNVQFLQGGTITEIMRYEDGYWEMFVGNTDDVSDDDVRVLPLGVMIGIDSSLEDAIQLSIGNGIWREDKEAGWKDWE